MMSMYKTEWITEDRKRVMDLERWYVLDGRHLKEHKLHGFYTGLAEKSKELEGELD